MNNAVKRVREILAEQASRIERLEAALLAQGRELPPLPEVADTQRPSAEGPGWTPSKPTLDRNSFESPEALRAHVAGLMKTPDLWFDDSDEALAFAAHADAMATEWEVSLVCPYCADAKPASRSTCSKAECIAARGRELEERKAEAKAEGERLQLEALEWVKENAFDLSLLDSALEGRPVAEVIADARHTIEALGEVDYPSPLHRELWHIDAAERLAEYERAQAAPPPEAGPELPNLPTVPPDATATTGASAGQPGALALGEAKAATEAAFLGGPLKAEGE